MEIEDIKKKLSESGWGSKSPSVQQRSFWLGLSRQEERWMPTLKESQIEMQHSSAGAGRKQKEQVEPAHCFSCLDHDRPSRWTWWVCWEVLWMPSWHMITNRSNIVESYSLLEPYACVALDSGESRHLSMGIYSRLSKTESFWSLGIRSERPLYFNTVSPGSEQV